MGAYEPYILTLCFLFLLIFGIVGVWALYVQGSCDSESKFLCGVLMAAWFMLIAVLISFIIRFQSNRIDLNIHLDSGSERKPPPTFRRPPPSTAELSNLYNPLNQRIYYKLDSVVFLAYNVSSWRRAYMRGDNNLHARRLREYLENRRSIISRKAELVEGILRTFLEFSGKEVTEFLNTPRAELGGKTPAQVVDNPDKRSINKLDNILKKMIAQARA